MGHFRVGPPSRACRQPGRAALERALREAIRPAGSTPARACRPRARWLRISARPEHDRRGVRAARRRGLADRRHRVGHAGRRPFEAVPPVLDAAGDRPAAATTCGPVSPTSPPSHRAAWLTAARKALNDAPADAFGYGDPRGRPELRHALAGYVSRARGVPPTPNASSSATASPRRCPCCPRSSRTGASTLAIEAYGHPSHRASPARAGARSPSTRTAPSSPDSATRTPRCSPPPPVPARRGDGRPAARVRCGGPAPPGPHRRGRLRRRVPLRPASRRSDAALAPHSIAYAGTASKTLAPGVRLGGSSRPRTWSTTLSPPRPSATGTPAPRPAHPRRIDHSRRVRPAHPSLPPDVPPAPRPLVTSPEPRHGSRHRHGGRHARRTQPARPPGRSRRHRHSRPTRTRRRRTTQLPARRTRTAPPWSWDMGPQRTTPTAAPSPAWLPPSGRESITSTDIAVWNYGRNGRRCPAASHAFFRAGCQPGSANWWGERYFGEELAAKTYAMRCPGRHRWNRSTANQPRLDQVEHRERPTVDIGRAAPQTPG